MNTEEDEFRRIEAEAKRREAQDDDDTQVYTSESAEKYSYRCGYEAGAADEPVCPACKAAVLYECVACSSNNYPPPQDNLAPLKWTPEDTAYRPGGLAQLKQKPMAWKLVPIKPTHGMLKAMDECSTEGYDERLYAGHAASVYMAAVNAAPTPPQRTWVGLTDDEIRALASWWPSYDQMPALMVLAKDIQENLKERNNG